MITKSTQLYLMGTINTLTFSHPDAAVVEHVLKVLAADLVSYEQLFSANDDNATLMQVNHAANHAAVVVPPLLFALMSWGVEHSKRQTGNLNIALGPLVKRWHIGFSDAQVPTAVQIATALKRCDINNVQLDKTNHTLRFLEQGMELDLGCLAKGYIADLLAKKARSLGITSGCINLGGNVLVIGSNATTHAPWKIGIQRPNAAFGENALVISGSSVSCVTSGVYERTLEVAGTSYHHIFDKNTGRPLPVTLDSLTIIAKSSLVAETWTTQLFGLPLAEIFKEIRNNPQLQGVAIAPNGKIYVSDPRLLQTSDVASLLNL